MSSINKSIFIFSFLLIFSISNVFAETFKNDSLNASASTNSPEAALTTEKSVYAKDEIVIIRGAGFRKFEVITLKVEQYDDQLGLEILRGTWIAVADRNGSFVSNWEVPANGRYTITGVGEKSGQEAQTVIAAAVTPIVIAGNPNCGTLNASVNPAFAHITSNFGFKIDPPASGTFTFQNATGRSLTGSAPTEPGSLLTITNLTGTTFDWSANRAIKAVIVKGGPNANVYAFNPYSYGDFGLTTVGGGSYGISHIEVCFDTTVVTSARVSVGGLITDEFGQPIPRTIVTIQNTNTLETQTVYSNTFGNYRFENLEVGDFYIITVYNKKYAFSPDTRSFVLNDAIENFNFSAVSP